MLHEQQERGMRYYIYRVSAHARAKHYNIL